MMGADSVPAFMSDRKARAWAMVEQRLGDAPFFGGEALTTADIMMIWSLTTGRAFGQFSLDDYPATRAYLQRIGERPAYRSARAKAEPGVEPLLRLTGSDQQATMPGPVLIPILGDQLTHSLASAGRLRQGGCGRADDGGRGTRRPTSNITRPRSR